MPPIATPANAVEDLRRAIAEYRAGKIDLDAFRRRRSAFGVYGLRGDPERVVVRVKIPLGRLTADQMGRVAALAANYTNDRCHITTRQALQLYGVPLDAAPELLQRLSEVGLTSCESAGNRVRNVTACPLAGICANECFDASECARAVAEFFHGHSLGMNLPRKFKIAFSGCANDCAATATHDVGAMAARDEKDGCVRLGFRILVGGGLGTAPRAGQHLEPFTPVNLLVPTVESVLRVFHAHGDRTNRSKARLKFLVERIGFEAFRSLVLRQRDQLAGESWRFPHIGEPETAPERPISADVSMPDDPAWADWQKTNIRAHVRGDAAAVTVRVPCGDLTSRQCRGLAAIARAYSRGQLRTTPSQNVIFPCVKGEHLATVHCALDVIGLSFADADRIQDVTSCPGAESCQIGITASRRLAAALAPVLEKPEYKIDGVSSLRIRVSGCNNSCSRHSVADIGFAGAAKPCFGKHVPHYDLVVGGGATNGKAWFARSIARIPAKRVPEALDCVLRYYRDARTENEPFGAFVERVGLPAVQEQVRAFTEVGPPEEEPDAYRDWGSAAPFAVGPLAREKCAV